MAKHPRKPRENSLEDLPLAKDFDPYSVEIENYYYTFSISNPIEIKWTNK